VGIHNGTEVDRTNSTPYRRTPAESFRPLLMIILSMSTQPVAGARGEFSVAGREKIAVVTDDMKTISPHFGMARHYLVYEVKAGEIVRRETRDKPGHGEGMHDHHGGGDVTSETANIHNSMLSNVADCAVLIARGMGTPMYLAVRDAGMCAYITQIHDADEAVKAFLAGHLDNHLELLH